MNTLMKVENEPQLARDPHSRAILVTDSDAYENWRKRKDLERSTKRRIDTLEGENCDLKRRLLAIERQLGIK